MHFIKAGFFQSVPFHNFALRPLIRISMLRIIERFTSRDYKILDVDR